MTYHSFTSNGQIIQIESVKVSHSNRGKVSPMQGHVGDAMIVHKGPGYHKAVEQLDGGNKCEQKIIQLSQVNNPMLQ